MHHSGCTEVFETAIRLTDAKASTREFVSCSDNVNTFKPKLKLLVSYNSTLILTESAGILMILLIIIIEGHPRLLNYIQ